MGTKKGQKRKTARRAYEKAKRRKARRAKQVLQPPPQIDARQILHGFGESRADLQQFHASEAMKAHAAYLQGGGNAGAQAALAAHHRQQIMAAPAPAQHVFPPGIQNFNPQGIMWGDQQHYQNPALPAPVHEDPAAPPGRAAPLAEQFPGPRVSYPRNPRPESVGDVENRRQAAAMAGGAPAGRGHRVRFASAKARANALQSNSMAESGRQPGEVGGYSGQGGTYASAGPLAADRLAGVLSGEQPLDDDDESKEQGLQGVRTGGGLTGRLKRFFRKKPKSPRGGAVGRTKTKRTRHPMI